MIGIDLCPRLLDPTLVNPEHRVRDAALPASGTTSGSGEAAPLREGESACQATARRQLQPAPLAGDAFFDVAQVLVDILFRYTDHLREVQCGHGLVLQKIDDLPANGTHD